MPTNRRTKKVEAEVRDLPMKQSAAEMVNGGDATGQHFRDGLIDMGGPTGLGSLAERGALAAGAGAAK